MTTEKTRTVVNAYARKGRRDASPFLHVDMMKRLELQFESQLQAPGAPGIRIFLAGDRAEAADIRVFRVHDHVRVIEQVVRFETELRRVVIAETEPLQQCEIEVPRARPAERVALGHVRGIWAEIGITRDRVRVRAGRAHD